MPPGSAKFSGTYQVRVVDIDGSSFTTVSAGAAPAAATCQIKKNSLVILRTAMLVTQGIGRITVGGIVAIPTVFSIGMNHTLVVKVVGVDKDVSSTVTATATVGSITPVSIPPGVPPGTAPAPAAPAAITAITGLRSGRGLTWFAGLTVPAIIINASAAGWVRPATARIAAASAVAAVAAVTARRAVCDRTVIC